MSSHDNEDLIDYEDDHDVPNGATHALAANGALSRAAADGDGDATARNFSGIHSTGFRCDLVLLFSGLSSELG